MSDYEHIKGTLIKVDFKEGEDLEKLCERILKENGKKRDNKMYQKAEIQLLDEFFEAYIIFEKELYSIIQENVDDEDTFINIVKNNDNSISFHTRYYNGGTCLTEMLEDGLNKI